MSIDIFRSFGKPRALVLGSSLKTRRFIGRIGGRRV